jgi:hypothetical protein
VQLARVTTLAFAVTTVAAIGAARADRVVAVAPLATLGAEDTSTATKKLSAQIEQAVAALGGTKVIGPVQVSEAIAKAKKPQLKACEGDTGCVVELGKLVGAQVVITGEVGGLGESKVVYLGATDVTTGKELRSTTLAIGSSDEAGGPAGAVVRLLEPDHYTGTIHLAIDAAGASVFVNGTKVALNGNGQLALPVGTQAIRVTHPEYHDFVRFIEVPYGKTVELAVGLQQYPIIEKNVRGLPTSRDKIEYIDPPLWRRWYVTGPAALGVAIAAGVIFYELAHAFPSCNSPSCTCRQVGGTMCP